MCQVLALETTSEVCSIAVNRGSKIWSHSIVAPRKHNQIILKMIDRLLESNEVRRAELDLIAFSAGPGSFTGVRLGASVAQGIAYGLGLQVVAVPTSEAMAWQVHRSHPDRKTCTLIRWSRRGWFYVSQFRWQDDVMECVRDDELLTENELPAGFDVVNNDQISLNALPVLEIARTRRQSSVPPDRALPRYVPGDSPYQIRSK